jgi:hypothetical protein
MRKLLIGLVVAMPFACGVAIAAADGGDQGPGGSSQSGTENAIVVGTVVSTDPANGSFVADAFVAGGCPAATGSTGNTGTGTTGNSGTGNTGTGNTGSGDDQGDNQGGGDQGDNQGDDDQGEMCSPNPGFGDGGGDNGGQGSGGGDNGGSGGDNGGNVGGDLRRHDGFNPPATALTQVTIKTDSNTQLFVNGAPGTVGDMHPGDHFHAVFNGPPSETIQTLVQSAALAVFDRTNPNPKQIYAFVGTVTNVTSTDPNDGTVAITVERSLPSGLAANGSSATLTVSADTLILGGSSGMFGGTLTDVSNGDIVVGALVAPPGETLAQVEASPLRVLLDLPAASAGSMTKAQKANARQKALNRALTLLGVKHATKSHKRSHKHHHSRTHAHR